MAEEAGSKQDTNVAPSLLENIGWLGPEGGRFETQEEHGQCHQGSVECRGKKTGGKGVLKLPRRLPLGPGRLLGQKKK